jgi:hypothetical protein
MILPLLAMTVALVVQDQTPLRGAAHENAPRQTLLTPGDWLEVRGEQAGFLQVYDQRRERPGYVRPSAVRSYVVDETAAPKLGPVIEYLKDAPGAESLGIGYVALFLRAAPAQMVGPELFDALGTMAERLGERASVRVARTGEASLAREIEVAESYGVHFASFERDGTTRICYDGEAFRRVLAMGGTGPARVRAALGLTDPDCVDPAIGASSALTLAKWRAGVLDAVDPSALGPEVPAYERARLRLRRSIVDEELSYFAARAGDAALCQQAGVAAKHELTLTDRTVIADEDRLAYEEAALRAASVRWAVEPASPTTASGIDVTVAAGAPGQTCMRVKLRASTQAPAFEHCTYGVVWPSSVRIAPHDAAVVVAVQPLEGWSELHIIHQAPSGWVADTLTPAIVDPELGYAELAGFSPDGAHLLVAREWRASGPIGSPHTLAPWMKRTFQVLSMNDLRVEREAASLGGLPSSKRWETADWKRGTLALR